jgi:hypothetical protein
MVGTGLVGCPKFGGRSGRPGLAGHTAGLSLVKLLFREKIYFSTLNFGLVLIKKTLPSKKR